MFTIACCLVVGLGLRLRIGLYLLSGWLVDICTRICKTFGCRCHTALNKYDKTKTRDKMNWKSNLKLQEISYISGMCK